MNGTHHISSIINELANPINLSILYSFQIFESGGFVGSLLSEVYLPVPEEESLQRLESFQFTSDQVISFGHTAVGSGEIRIYHYLLLTIAYAQTNCN